MIYHGERVICTIREGDYRIAKDALDSLDRGESSISRVIGAFYYGGRARWGAIVSIWEQGLSETPPSEQLQGIVALQTKVVFHYKAIPS